METILSDNKRTEIRESEPVFVWSPVKRCGTELLQALITSSGEILVCGEDAYMTQLLPEHYSKLTEEKQREFDAGLRDLAEGEVSNSVAHAVPGERRKKALEDHLLHLAEVYRSEAAQYGYQRWGSAQSKSVFSQISAIKEIFPNSKHVFIYRNLEAVIESVKAEGLVESKRDVARLANNWSVRLRKMLTDERDEPNNLILAFEELTGEVEESVERISEFLGISNLEIDILERVAGNAEEALNPAALDAEPLKRREKRMIREFAEDTMILAGYNR